MERIICIQALLVAATATAASSTPPPPPASSASASLMSTFPPIEAVTRPIDLTHPLDEAAIEWPGTEPFTVLRNIASTEKGYFYAHRDISLSEHVGTHMDAPYHFNQNGQKIGKIPVSKLIAPAIVLDGESAANATAGIKQLQEWRKKHGPLPPNSVVLIRFNWSRYYWQRDVYFGPHPTTPEFPGITAELADAFVKADVIGVGIDTPSIDPGFAKHYRAHRTLAAANIYILENVALPMSLPPKGWTIISMPIKLSNGTGAPCRVIAVPNNYNTASSLTTNVILVVAIFALTRFIIT